MLQHVYERASQARYLTSMIIATDDERVYEVARNFGARVRMTRADHLSGTDRVAEVASADTAEIIVNIQGDEPLIDPDAIDAAILPLVHDPEILMAHAEEADRRPAPRSPIPNVVKVVTDRRGRCHLLFALPDSVSPGRNRPGSGTALLQTCGPVCLPARFPAGLFHAAGRTAGRGRAAGAVAGARERLSHPRRGNGYESLGVDTPEDLEKVSRLFESSLRGVNEHG